MTLVDLYEVSSTGERSDYPVPLVDEQTPSHYIRPVILSVTRLLNALDQIPALVKYLYLSPRQLVNQNI